MKIIAKTNGAYLVEMSSREIVRAAGFGGENDAPNHLFDFDGSNRKIGLKVGITVEFVEPTTRLRKIAEQETKVRSNASLLRGLADMLESLTPSQIIAPEAPASEEA